MRALPAMGLLALIALASPTYAAEPDPPEPTLSARIDALFSPIAEGASKIMFWDPLAAVGLHDPTLRGEDGEILRDEAGRPREARIPLVVLWLIVAAVFFTARMRFVNFRVFGHAWRLIRGDYDDEDAPGEVSHFQALSTALSGTVGLGNIAGVAIAISIGGPGATFWMLMAGLLGMATKFTECSLAVKYREIEADGTVRGGPMYYLRQGLAQRRVFGVGLAPLGRGLAFVWAFFAMLGSFAGGNMFQSNQSFAMVKFMAPGLADYGVWFGLVLAALVAVVIIGGIKSIGKVTGVLVPLMGLLYVGTSLIVILFNLEHIGGVFSLIFAEAFAPSAAQGGIIGVMVIGLRRAAFSNEAGVGTAAVAHSATKTSEPISEGVIASLGPMIDTVIICTMTALVLIFTGFHEAGGGLTGAALTSAAFGSVFSWFPWLLTGSILLFSFSTLLSFSYYGQQCFDYCFGGLLERVLGSRKIGRGLYRAVFLFFVTVGASINVDAVLAYSDMIIFALITTNTIGLFILSGEVRADMVVYWGKLKRGELERG